MFSERNLPSVVPLSFGVILLRLVCLPRARGNGGQGTWEAGFGSKGASVPAPNRIDLLDPVLLRQAWVIRAALEHGLFELPLLLSLEVVLAATLFAPANSTLADIEAGEFCGRREPTPLTAGGLRVFAALIGTRAALWPAPLLLATASPPSPLAFSAR